MYDSVSFDGDLTGSDSLFERREHFGGRPVNVPNIEVVFFDLGETLVTTNRAWRPGARALLDSLRHEGYRLGVVSNTGSLARAALLDILPADFDFAAFESDLILLSSEIGIEKPSPKIFTRAVEAAGVSADQCLYCTENAVETLAAQHAGMRTLRIQTAPHDELFFVEEVLSSFHALLQA